MKKKYCNIRYSNVNIDGELKVSGFIIHGTGKTEGYLVKEYKREKRYREREVKGLWGPKMIAENYTTIVATGKFLTYVEEVEGKYYDVITGIEVIPEKYVDWSQVEKIDDKYYYKNEELNKDNVESKKLKFVSKHYVSIKEVYDFLKGLTNEDVELYCQRMEQAIANIDKVQEQRMSKLLYPVNEQKVQEDFVSNFRENYGFRRNRTR